MENSWTQLGLAGATLAILFFIVKYFVATLNKKDVDITELNKKFIELSEKNITSHNELAQALDKNTQSNKEVATATKEGNDKLTAMILKVIKNGSRRRKTDG